MQSLIFRAQPRDCQKRQRITAARQVSTAVKLDSGAFSRGLSRYTACGSSRAIAEKPMIPLNKTFFCLITVSLAASMAAGQAQQTVPDSNLITKSVKAIGYRVGGGSTKVDLKGTELMSAAGGEAKVEAKPGATTIELSLIGMTQPSTLGAEFLTYVLWVVTPDGRSGNIGEIFPVNDFKLMRRAQYEKLGNPLAMTPDLERVPLQLYEARNAVDIAKSRGADKDAPEIFPKATSSLQMAENALASKADKKDIVSKAGQAIQFAEDARALAAQRQNEARIAADREAAAAKAKTEAEAKAAEEAKRQAELTAAKEAQMKAEAEAAAVKAKAEADAAAAKAKAEADAAAAKAKAEADALKAKEEAARAEAERSRKAAAELRAQLLDQFNRVLETRDTPRGLVVNMGDVLFDFGKYDLRSEAREKLAKLTGIVLAHPGLKLAVEGHTDSVGGDEANQKLSEQRADAVSKYLIEEGLADASVSSQGFGKTSPVADNDTAAGRQ